MPCMLLYGDSGVGKTMLFEKTECQHPNPHHERHGHDGGEQRREGQQG